MARARARKRCCWDAAEVGRSLATGRHGLSWLLLVGVASLLRARGAHAEDLRPSRSVLMIYDQSKDTPGNITFDRAVQGVLRGTPERKIDYFVEHLDLARFPGERHMSLMRDHLRRKYAARPIDVIIASNVASRLLLESPLDFFPGTPIVSATVFPHDTVRRSEDARLTAIRADFDARRTLELALRLHPGTQKVLVVAGNSLRDGSVEDEARRQLTGLEDRVEVGYIRDVAVSEVVRRAAALPPRSVVLFISFYEDPSRGRFVHPHEVAARMAASASVPVYSVFDSHVQEGVVGGYTQSSEANGALAGGIALRILDGASPRDIPSTAGVIVPTFDWRQLRRWGIDEKQLPEGSVVRFRPPSLWHSHRAYVVGVLTLCLLQMTLIGALLLERRRRRRAMLSLNRFNAELEQRIHERKRAETALQESEARFRAVVEDQAELVCRFLPDGTITFVNEAYCRYFDTPRERLVGASFFPLIPVGYHEPLKQLLADAAASGQPTHRGARGPGPERRNRLATVD